MPLDTPFHRATPFIAGNHRGHVLAVDLTRLKGHFYWLANQDGEDAGQEPSRPSVDEPRRQAARPSTAGHSSASVVWMLAAPRCYRTSSRRRVKTRQPARHNQKSLRFGLFWRMDHRSVR